jgi:hypothetical protein
MAGEEHMNRHAFIRSLPAFLLALTLPAGATAQDDPTPEGLGATCTIVGGSALRGTNVTLPLLINASIDSPDPQLQTLGFQGFSISIDFDEEVLEFVGFIGPLGDWFGEAWSFSRLTSNGSNDTPGNAGVDEGYLVGGVAFCIRPRAQCGPSPPLETDNEVLRLEFHVKPDAPLGPTEVRFLDGARAFGGPPIANVVTLAGFDASLRFDVTPTLINAALGIVDDISMFVRGDANSDLTVNVSDALWTLNYLFLGASAPLCLDAADANDDGEVNITDPVVTLQVLFLGGASLPPPNVSPGNDPTADDPFICPRS